MGWDFADELKKFGPTSGGVYPRRASFARAYCRHVTTTHYENFPVASLLLPRPLIPHFHAVYAYCRWADDLADETGGDALELLDWWRRELLTVYTGEPTHPVMIALRETVRRFAIPPEPFLNLLIAFEQDQRQKSFATFADLLGYCRNSANPVGHLVLYLFESFDARRAKLSDDICTGLQLANFWQDVRRDLDIGRVYIPEDDRRQFGYLDEELRGHRFTPAFADLLRFQVARTRELFDRGDELFPLLPRRARVDVRLFSLGGRSVLDAIERQRFDVWAKRPTVSKWAKAKLLVRSLL